MIHVTINTTIGNNKRRPQHFTAPDRPAALDIIYKNIHDLTISYKRQTGLALDTISETSNAIILDLQPAVMLFNSVHVVYFIKEV